MRHELLQRRVASAAPPVPARHTAGPANGQKGDELLALQRRAGNRAVTALLQRKTDEEESEERESEEDATAGRPGPNAVESLPEESEADETEGSELLDGLSGVLPDLGTPEGEAVVKGPLDTSGNDRAVPSRPRRKEHRPAPAGATVIPLRAVGSLTFSTVQKDPSGFVSKDDSIQATTTTSWSNPGGKRTSAFGSESFNPTFKKPTWTAAGGAIKLDLHIDVKCPWGVKSSNVDIPNGTSPKIRADNYEAIVDDLTPVLEGKSWRAPRGKYWSKELCGRHEQYHSTDDKGWAEGPGKQLVTNFLNAQSVILTGDDKKSVAKTRSAINRQVKEAVADAKDEFEIANSDFYTGGAAEYVDYAGEERANLDGKPHYEALASEVLKQGQKLEQQKQDEEDQKVARKKLKGEQKEAARLAKEQSAEEKRRAKQARSNGPKK